MAVFGRPEFIPIKQRDSILELAGVRGFDGEFEKSMYVKGVEGKDVAPGSASALALDAARVQQQVSKAQSENWAEVHAVGMGEKGVFVVLDHYAKTAEDLIKAGTPLSGRGLYRIVISVLRGLRDLQQVAGRPHGNLKASNVLLSSLESQDARIVLTDPAPPQWLARGKAKDDLFQLGQLIHELVLHHPFTGAWPVAPTRAWSDLGRSGRGWRKLCNRLLNPNPEKRPRRLAWVHGRVLALRPRRVGMLRPIVALLLIGVIGAAVTMNWGRIEKWSKATWRKGVAAATQPHKADEEQPRQLVVVPQDVKVPATQHVEDRSTLATESAFLTEYHGLYEQRGWTGPAQYLANLRARFTTTSAADPSARKALADTEELLKQIEARWRALGEKSKLIAERAHNDPVLLTYPQFVKQAIAPITTRSSSVSPLPALLEAMDKTLNDATWNSTIAYLQSTEAQQLDHAWMIESSPLHKRFTNKTVASAEDLQQWLAEAKRGEFQRLASSDDPRPRWSARQQIARIRSTDLAKLASLYKDAAEAKKASASFDQKLAQLDQSAAQVLDSQTPWSMKTRPEITAAIGRIDQEITRISESLRGAVATRQNELEQVAAREAAAMRQKQEALEFAGKLEAKQVSAVAAVQKEWQARTKGIVDDIRADVTRFNQNAAQKAIDIQQRLAIVDAAIKTLPEKLDLKAGTAAWNERLLAAIAQLDAKERQRLVDDLLDASRQMPVDDLKARAEQDRKKYDDWGSAAGDLLADLNEVDRLLAVGYALDERPANNRPAARDILAQWQKQDWFNAQGIQSAISPLLAPIQVLERADGSTLVQIAAASEHRLGLRLTAWRKIAKANATWPAEREDLQQAASISDSLFGAIESKAPAERRESLKADVAGTMGTLWNRFAVKAARPQDITFALELRDKLAMPSEIADGRMRFNAALYDARKAKSGDENRVTASLQSALEALPAAQRDSRELADLMAAMRQAKAGAQRIDFATLGPMARGPRPNPISWKVKYDQASETVSYAARVSMDITPDELEIVFKRVATDSGDVYLSTSEVSCGLFADVITASDRWRDVAPMLWSYDPRDGDPRPGPRSWEWPRYGRLTSGIRRTNVWLAGSGDHYPETLATSENRTVLKDETGRPAREFNPSKRQPMQYVSPQAAIYFSDLLSCRLPTNAEWKAAYRLHAGDHWNLRDHTFKVLQRWLYGPSVAERFMPDLGIFMSANEKPTAETWTESRVLGRADQSDAEYNDGVLWFREVAPAGTTAFSHLVGNVAEMTLENGHVYTIGGSALSPPTRPVDQELEIPNWKGGNKGYSDVGFRLAFSGPANPRQQLLAALEKQNYLLP